MKRYFMTLLIFLYACGSETSASNNKADADSGSNDDVSKVDNDFSQSDLGQSDLARTDTDQDISDDMTDPIRTPGAAVLRNFRVDPANPDRVLFDSTGDIGTLTDKGFVVNDREITGLILGDDLTGHYFTIDTPFTYWDHNTIRLGEIDESATGDGTVADFQLRYIKNNIPRPVPSGTDLFVDASVNRSGDGLTEAAAFKTITEGISALKDVQGGGGSLWIKAGTYPETIPERIMQGLTGTETRPIYISGYQNTKGDNPRVDISYPDKLELDPTKMPMIENSTGFGLPIIAVEYAIIQNIQVKDSQNHGVYITGGTRLSVIENIVINLENTPPGRDGFYQNNRTESRLKFLDLVVMEASTNLLRAYGEMNFHSGNRVYSFTGRGGNYAYYFNGSNNILRDLDVRVGGQLGQHGFTLKGDNKRSEHNLLENSQIWGQTAGMEARHVEVRFNVYRNVLVTTNPVTADDRSITACNVWGGASYNVFDGIRHSASGNFATLLYSKSDDLIDRIGHHNIFKNSVVYKDPDTTLTRDGFVLIRGDENDAENGIAHDNQFYNNTVYGVRSLVNISGGDTSRNDVFTNNIFQNTEVLEVSPTATFTNNVFWENDFDAVANNLEMDPKLTDPENHDFSLAADSPVMDLGLDIEDLIFDFTRTVRIPGKRSIGAYERD